MPIAPPSPGLSTSENSMTKWAMVLAAICAVLPAALDAFTENVSAGKGWSAAIAAAIIAAAIAYTRYRSSLKIRHEEVKGDAVKALADGVEPADKARALERMGDGMPGIDLGAKGKQPA